MSTEGLTCTTFETAAARVEIELLRSLNGPNVYSHKPVVVIVLGLTKTGERLAADAGSVVERVRSVLPSLGNPDRAWDDRSILVRPGMPIVDLVEEVALALLRLAGAPAHMSRQLATTDRLRRGIAFAYAAEHATTYLLEQAVGLVNAALAGCDFDVDAHLREARRICARTELGPSTRAIVEAAERRGIPWMRVNSDSLVQLGYGVNRKFVQAALSSRTASLGVEIAGDKHLTKTMLEQAAVPVPRGVEARTEEEAVAAIARLTPPLVVKPLDGHQGKGVSLNLTTPEEVAHAFRIAREFAPVAIVEEMFRGRDYRVLVVDGRVVAASERIAAHVVGDGKRTIAQLVEVVNLDPRRGDGHEKPLTRLKVGPIASAYLARRGLTTESVPEAGRVVYLRESANLSKGGIAKDVTECVHPSVARMCERAARTIGLDICGVDLVLEDIAAPYERGKGAIIELNAAPGLRMHVYPSEGTPRDVGGAIVESLYPAGASARIPIIAITGTNGKTTTTRMIAHVVAAQGPTVGVTTTDGIWVGGELVTKGDTTGPISARAVLSDPTVEVAVLETARGGIVRRGLGYDWADVAVITNIQPDHIGQDGITSVDDIFTIKSIVAERVRDGGTIVLNADDERLARLPEHGRVGANRKRVVFFSLHESSVMMRRHLSRNGVGFYLRQDGWIVESHGYTEHKIVKASAVPATLGGAAEHNVANALAAIAACRAYGLDASVIAEALKTFGGAEHNSGRTNLYRAGAGYVLVDYSHNADGFRAIARMASSWGDRPRTAVVTMPGDRTDDAIAESARVVAESFDRVFVCEDRDLRGREEGEVASLVARTIRDAAPDVPCTVIRDQPEALALALRTMGEGEVIAVFFDKLEPILETLEDHGARPAERLESAVIQPRKSA